MAEGNGFENRRRLLPTVGSNPTLSAIFFAPIRFFKSESVCVAVDKIGRCHLAALPLCGYNIQREKIFQYKERVKNDFCEETGFDRKRNQQTR